MNDRCTADFQMLTHDVKLGAVLKKSKYNYATSK